MKLVFVVAAVALLTACASPDGGGGRDEIGARYQAEWRAFTVYLASEVNAGRMSREEANWRAAGKRRELEDAWGRELDAADRARAARGAALIGAGATLGAMSAPARLPGGDGGSSSSTSCVTRQTAWGLVTDCR